VHGRHRNLHEAQSDAHGITVNALALILRGRSSGRRSDPGVAGGRWQVHRSRHVDGPASPVLAFLTAYSYSELSPPSTPTRSGSSYYFAEAPSSTRKRQQPEAGPVHEADGGWISHLYYWIIRIMVRSPNDARRLHLHHLSSGKNASASVLR